MHLKKRTCPDASSCPGAVVGQDAAALIFQMADNNYYFLISMLAGDCVDAGDTLSVVPSYCN